MTDKPTPGSAAPAMSNAARGLRERLLEWNTRQSDKGGWDFLLSDEPLTKAQVAKVVSGALWASFSGWDYSDADAGRVAAIALEAARPRMFDGT